MDSLPQKINVIIIYSTLHSSESACCPPLWNI